MTNDIKIGLIGGSGFAKAISAITAISARTDSGAAEMQRHTIDTPFGKPSDDIVQISSSGLPLFFLNRHGPGHQHHPGRVPYRANIFALKQLGVTHILATGAVGSLREEMKPRDLVIADQIINKTTGRDATFFDDAAVHVEFSEPLDAALRQILIDAAQTTNDGTTHTRGCYVAMNGPAFSTRAESLMHRLWGGDLIGMTAMPEAVLAREAEIAYALVAIVTDYDSWRGKPVPPNKAAEPMSTPHPTQGSPDSLLDEIIGNLSAGSERAIALIQAALALMAERKESLAASPALSALKLAIWSEKVKIPQESIERLAPLWLKYFSS